VGRISPDRGTLASTGGYDSDAVGAEVEIGDRLGPGLQAPCRKRPSASSRTPRSARSSRSSLEGLDGSQGGEEPLGNPTWVCGRFRRTCADDGRERGLPRLRAVHERSALAGCFPSGEGPPAFLRPAPATRAGAIRVGLLTRCDASPICVRLLVGAAGL